MDRKKTRRSTNVSDKCFRLLRLKREVQNDARVMKAVVDEVDVLRLCHSLGMAVSDEGNRALMYKFEFGMFTPSRYDADFARFVREKLALGHHVEDHASEEKLEIGSLFGKQCGVKAELVRMGFWGHECEIGLAFQEQGVYCIERSGDGHGTHREFVAFAWLSVDLFEPEAVRDTPAYVLRFLMSLSSNITCCLSRDDYQRVESQVHAVSSSTSTQWNSCSVAFRVQKQEEQSDNVHCAKSTKASIPHLNPIKNVEFVGGVFPAVAVESATPSTTERLTDSVAVPTADFGDWIQAKHLHFALELPRDQPLPAAVRDFLLEKFGHFPHEELNELQRKSVEQQESNAANRPRCFRGNARTVRPNDSRRGHVVRG
ncbi:hypothetical protein PHYPSEUDO_009757 [Phytophthora pseudosyringae]|uniref:Uncharacterized protein n=1 Tax=Phytophthora pseudosyringae TaxID=221518 RepID=A0A8T1VEZ3_9STRA|nr:hypothetical protein PHYPSEUDO_009757 [Phytophthora pseudosyringae]